MTNRFLFIHIHTPKCGGTSFQYILHKNFTMPRSFYWDDALIVHKHTAENIERTIKVCPWLQAISSHHVSIDLPFQLEQPEIIAIAFVRDPVERFISAYYMHRNAPPTSRQPFPNAKSLNLTDFAKWGLIDGNTPHFIQGQISHLTRMEGSAGLFRVHELIGNQQLLLFPLSRFDEACLVLEKKYPQFFKDCSYRKQNVSRIANPATSEETIGMIRDSLAPYDDELVKLANQQIDNLIKEHYASPETVHNELEKFRQRCALLR